MVLRWTADATAELRRRIDRGQINPNFEDAPYLGDVVSGEHFPEYEALPPAFVDCLGASGLNGNCKDSDD